MAGETNVKENKIQDLDSLLGPLGGFGKFQIINLFFLCLIVMLSDFSELGYIFSAGQVKHRCLIPECESGNATWGNDDSKPWLSHYIPKTSSGSWDSCLRYDSTSQNCDISSVGNTTHQCEKFIYESDEMTIVREGWGLVCDSDKVKLSLIGSLNSAGQVFGGLYVGYLSDRFGRRVIISMSLVLAVLGIIKTFSVNYAMMAVFEFVEASLVVALFNGAFVMALEMVEPSKRVLAGTIAANSYSLGQIILGLVQYLTLDWKTTLRILYAPYFLSFTLYWIIPESVRWLLSKKRMDEAVTILQRISKRNGTTLDMEQVKLVLASEMNKAQENESATKNMFLKLLQSKVMRWRVAACYFSWMCGIFIYFGMTLNSVSVNDDKFLNYILTGLIEIPAHLIACVILERWGRRITVCSSFLLCGVACILDAYIPTDDSWSWAVLVLYLLGKFGGTIALVGVDVFTTELFPTALRSTMMSTGLMAGKIASIVAPEIPLLADIYKPLPLLIFGALSLGAGFVSLVFPETLHMRLPDTIEEAENLGKSLVKDERS